VTKWWVLSACLICVLVACVGATPVASCAPASSHSAMPPNELKIAQALMQHGRLAPDATADDIEAAVSEYVRHKLKKVDVAEPEASVDEMRLKGSQAKARRALVEKAEGRLLHGKKLGAEPYPVDPAQEQPWTGEVQEDMILVLLVEFTDPGGNPVAAPEHNCIPEPGPRNNSDLWTSDFGREHYQGMLFTEGGYTTPEGLHLPSMRDYYLEQSGGGYTVDGQVYGWYKVAMPESYYGDDHPSGGHDNNPPGTSRDLIADAVHAAAEAGVPFMDYDNEDPYDLDADGDLDEPDGIVDHLMVVHAGVGQEAGGGAQGDDSIWSHSASTFVYAAPGAKVDYWGGWTVTYNYTIMPENGAIGVFCHEFAHDLGLPDEYDTIYSGEASTAFWSLMSSGSWLGRPLGTRPSPLSPWGRMVLGTALNGDWVQPAYVSYEDITPEGEIYLLDQTVTRGLNDDAIRIQLPDKEKYVNDPYGGEWEWFGGKADEADHRLDRTVDLTGFSSATLDFWTWYEIEEGWDFGFVQVSTDGGQTWTSMETERTTYNHNPSAMESIVANLPGYTGSSGGWVHEVIDLTPYAGTEVQLRFRYMTDWAATYAGFYVDEIRVTADGQEILFDDAESLDPGWTAVGWKRDKGYEMKPHYYLLEWRNHAGFDESLRECYNFPSAEDYAAGYVEFFPYERGLLLWHRDTAFTDNWVGEHPGEGFLLVTDAHFQPMTEPTGGRPWRTRIQMHDAAFGLEGLSPITLTRGGHTRTYQAKSPSPEFNDDRDYWVKKAPDNSVLITDYGIGFRVVGVAPDGSAAAVVIYRRCEGE